MVWLFQTVRDRSEKENERIKCLDSQLKEWMLYDLANSSLALCSHKIELVKSQMYSLILVNKLVYQLHFWSLLSLMKVWKLRMGWHYLGGCEALEKG